MKQQDWLFPHVFRKAGWLILALLSFIFLLSRSEAGQKYSDHFQDISDQINFAGYTDTVTNIFIIGFAIGLLLVAFSREKHEDEMIQKLRLQALQWSVYVNYFVLILCSLLFYWVDFFNVLVLNMYTVLFVFVMIFRWTLHQMNKESLS